MARRKLGRRTDNRTALLRNLATDVIAYESIETTEEKAKELRSVVDKMITLGKRGDLHARRQAAAVLYERNLDEGETVLQKLFGEIAERYTENEAHLERQGGYTRIRKLGPRRGDGANMVIISLVEERQKVEA